jgi:hypothetical protein
MTEKLINSRLGAVFSTDPAVALWTWVKSVWGTSTGYSVPANTAIKFDTKFGDMKGFLNYFIVENMPSVITPQVLGGTRTAVEEVKRIQILCIGTAAKNTKWLMERHIDSLINSNRTGMQATYGIDEISLDSFTDIATGEGEEQKTGLFPNRAHQRVRSFANVTMKYQQEATTA